jgi:ATP-binding cassette subfamily B protein
LLGYNYTAFHIKLSILELDYPLEGTKCRYQSRKLYNQAPKKVIFNENQYIKVHLTSNRHINDYISLDAGVKLKTNRRQGMSIRPMAPIPNFRGAAGNRFLQETQKPKNALSAARRILELFRNQRRGAAILFLFVLISSAAAIAGPYLIGRAIDALNMPEGGFELPAIVLALAGMYLADAASKFCQGWITAGMSQEVVRNLRQSLFEKFAVLPILYFDSNPHGELMSRISNDTDNIAGILATAITQFISIAVVLASTLAVMLWLSPIMTFFSLASIPLVFLLSKTISRHTSYYFKRQQAQLGKLNARVEEDIAGMAALKSYSRERQAASAFAVENEELRRISTSAAIWSGYIMPIMNVINNLSFAIVAGAGGFLAVNGAITLGVAASFINYSRQFGRPLNELAGTYNQLQSALASAERVFEVLDEAPEMPDVEGAEELLNPKGLVEFNHVSFSYKSGREALKDVSFTAPPGSAFALVGPTGAGKTTVANLIARFYEAESGEVRIDGRDIRDYTRRSLRRAFGIVLQDAYLFTGTIMDNIRYGRAEASEEEAVEAAKMAGCHSFISRLPQGYFSVITENSQTLSQGQKQLLAIARVMLYKPAMLILDEATSSVDTRTELRIQESMAKLAKGRTTFAVAHRISTVAGSDAIMVINSGRLSEIGSHAELMELGGSYCRMFTLQSGGFSIDDEPQ